ncbi:transposase [Methanospirillum sp. J.3.6.1-F.2.7.3]|uniref:Transposase n=1 Tax=Methanospirillum purgamenti TaxID=2834276 RepID=A0A8E7AZI5_9EURY|nr:MULTISPECIES: transposase [Methanospirillum]MDX8550378.1 transposase [Methanospirillum hungatei]QVV88074.1 transposase [Methanospirillum sp. J.3.6.1-F.2.7.3]
MYNTIGRDFEQLCLLPEDIRDWVPNDDFCHILIDLVSILDLSPLYKEYREDGQGAAFYHPEIMTGLIIYSYFHGVRSSRQIENKCRYDVGFRVVTRNSLPDHSTISRFIKKNSSFIGQLFIPVLTLLNEAGLINNVLLALDGTKMKANASLGSNMPYEKIEGEIQKYLKEIQEEDELEDHLYGPDKSGNEVPDDLKTHSRRMKRFIAAKERLEAEHNEKSRKQEEKIIRRKEEEQESGKRKRGRKPKMPAKNPDEQRLGNTTDPDSSLMKSGPGCIQGYNGQVIVNQDGYILVPFLSNSPVDYRLLQSCYERLEEIAQLTGLSLEYLNLLTDAGHWSYENYLYMKQQNIGFFCSTCHEPNIFSIRGLERSLLELDSISDQLYDGICCIPTLASIGYWCTRHLIIDDNIPTPASIAKGIMEVILTPYGAKKIYAQRKAIVEPAFGWIKENRSIRKLQRSGISHCQDEWSLICLTQNLRKVCSRGELKYFRELILQKKHVIISNMGLGIDITYSILSDALSFMGRMIGDYFLKMLIGKSTYQKFS